MRSLLLILIVSVGLLTASCGKDDSKPSYEGLYNTDCDTHTGTAIIESGTIKHGGYCLYGTANFTVSGNTMTIPYQRVGDDYHQATGTITENSFTLTYRVTRFGSQLYVFKLKGVK